MADVDVPVIRTCPHVNGDRSALFIQILKRLIDRLLDRICGVRYRKRCLDIADRLLNGSCYIVCNGCSNRQSNRLAVLGQRIVLCLFSRDKVFIYRFGVGWEIVLKREIVLLLLQRRVEQLLKMIFSITFLRMLHNGCFPFVWCKRVGHADIALSSHSRLARRWLCARLIRKCG